MIWQIFYWIDENFVLLMAQHEKSGEHSNMFKNVCLHRSAGLNI